MYMYVYIGFREYKVMYLSYTFSAFCLITTGYIFICMDICVKLDTCYLFYLILTHKASIGILLFKMNGAYTDVEHDLLSYSF